MPIPVSKSEIITQLHQLPSLPIVVQEIIASFSNPELNRELLAQKVAQDMGLSARVLRVANSPFYGLSRKVGSIQDALVILGFDTVRSLVLSAGIIHLLPTTNSLFDRQAYLQRSFRIAAVAGALAKCTKQDSQIAFVAGMFHDIGQLVLDMLIPEQFSRLLSQHPISDSILLDIERTELGFDHAEIGADMIRLWNFPLSIEEAVRYWHKPEQQEKPHALTCLLHVAVLLDSGAQGADLIAGLPEKCSRHIPPWERIETCLPKAEQLNAAASLAIAS